MCPSPSTHPLTVIYQSQSSHSSSCRVLAYLSISHLDIHQTAHQSPSHEPALGWHRPCHPSPQSFIKPSLTPAKGTHQHWESCAQLMSLLVLFSYSCSKGPKDYHDPNESPCRRHREDLGAGLPGQHPHPSIHPHCHGDNAMPMDSFASTPALYGVGLVALGCISAGPHPCSRHTTGFAHSLHPFPCRTKSSLSPSSPGHEWEAGSSMAAPSTMARS